MAVSISSFPVAFLKFDIFYPKNRMWRLINLNRELPGTGYFGFNQWSNFAAIWPAVSQSCDILSKYTASPGIIIGI